MFVLSERKVNNFFETCVVIISSSDNTFVDVGNLSDDFKSWSSSLLQKFQDNSLCIVKKVESGIANGNGNGNGMVNENKKVAETEEKDMILKNTVGVCSMHFFVVVFCLRYLQFI